MHITNVTNLLPGDIFAPSIGGPTFVAAALPMPVQDGSESKVVVPVLSGGASVGEHVELYNDAAVVIDGPVRLRPLRHDVAPAYDALDVSTPSTAWVPTCRSFRGVGYSIGDMAGWPSNGDECHGLTGYVALMADADGRRRPVA